MRAHDILYVGGLPRAPVVDDALQVGGMGVIAATLVDRLAARGHAVRTLSAVAEDDRTGRFVGVGPDVEIIPYDMPRPVHSPTSVEHFEMHGQRIRAALRPLLEHRPPEIVLVGHHAYLDAFPDAMHGRPIPWLVWIHTTVLPAMIFGDGVVADTLAQRMMQGMREASGLIGVADHVAKDLVAVGGASVAAIPNAVDLDLFAPRADPARLRSSLGFREDDIIAVHVSNLKRMKRVDDLVRSAEQALKSNPRLVYVIVGEGPCRREVEEVAAATGLSDRIVLTGWLPRQMVAEHLGVAAIAILPSQAEGLSLALLEALACGCAVIASDIASSREVIEDGVSGLLFSVGDTQALTRHTLALAADPGRRAALAAAGRRRVEQRHGMDLMIDRFEAAFERTVRDGRL